MTTIAQWVAGARPRTLPAAFAPVIGGTGVAVAVGRPDWLLAALALVVAVALQVAVNYANDYSDGIKGTDAERVGPMRLVGSQAASPSAVKRAALISFVVAAVAGLAVTVVTGWWWLLIVGTASIVAAWFYTGGKRPYGYAGWGEVSVFVFFGLVAVMGTAAIQTRTLPAGAISTAVGLGLLACAVLVANNLRDLAGDSLAGKRTLATRLGDRYTRWLYAGCATVAMACVVLTAAQLGWPMLLGLIALGPLSITTAAVLRGAAGRQLIRVLALTGLGELVCAIGLALGAWWIVG